MRHNRNGYGTWIRGIALAVCLAGPVVSATGQEKDSERLFEEFNWSSFQEFEPAQQEIDFDRVNTNLLSAAVFHETNRRREREGLPALAHHSGARRAAALQAKVMAARGSISHQNPEQPELATLQDRLAEVGLRPRFAAENVATAFGLQYESGKPFFERVENGRTIYSFKPNGPPIPPHTYLSFAKALLDQWMNSPGHRKNIVSSEPEFLGASSLPGKTGNSGKSGPRRSGPSRMPVFYCAQVFYTPLK